MCIRDRNNGINKIQVDPFVHGIYWFALKDELNNEKVVKLSVIKEVSYKTISKLIIIRQYYFAYTIHVLVEEKFC